jgi:CheY-like chemotaxis protein
MAKTILVADDSVTIRKVVELTFHDTDIRVESTGSGREALEKISVLKPDLVLADVIIPEPSGYEICRSCGCLMTFVESEYQVIALFSQNELHQIEPGDEAEFTLLTYPGEVIKAHVDSIVWAQGQGQIANTSTLPQTGYAAIPPNRFPVKLTVDPKFKDLFLAAGAVGSGAVYTQHGAMIHIVRKVILRVGAKTDYLVLKLH